MHDYVADNYERIDRKTVFANLSRHVVSRLSHYCYNAKDHRIFSYKRKHARDTESLRNSEIWLWPTTSKPNDTNCYAKAILV